jgi:hypothetical protein
MGDQVEDKPMLLLLSVSLLMIHTSHSIRAGVCSSTLQKVVYDEGKRCLLVTVEWNLTRLRRGDFFRDKVSDVRLFVSDYFYCNRSHDESPNRRGGKLRVAL